MASDAGKPYIPLYTQMRQQQQRQQEQSGGSSSPSPSPTSPITMLRVPSSFPVPPTPHNRRRSPLASTIPLPPASSSSSAPTSPSRLSFYVSANDFEDAFSKNSDKGPLVPPVRPNSTYGARVPSPLARSVTDLRGSGGPSIPEENENDFDEQGVLSTTAMSSRSNSNSKSKESKDKDKSSSFGGRLKRALSRTSLRSTKSTKSSSNNSHSNSSSSSSSSPHGHGHGHGEIPPVPPIPSKLASRGVVGLGGAGGHYPYADNYDPNALPMPPRPTYARGHGSSNSQSSLSSLSGTGSATSSIRSGYSGRSSSAASAMSIETGLGIGIDDQGRWMHPRKIDSSSNLSAKSGDKTSTSPPVSPISPTSPTSSKSSTSPTHTRRPSLSRDPAKNWLTAEPPPTATAPVFARGNRAGGSGTGRGRTAGVVMPVRKEDWIREQRRKSMQAGGVPGGMMSPAERARRQSMIAMGSSSSASPTSPTNAGAAVPPMPTPPIPARRSSTASPAEAMAATSNLSSRPSPSPTSLSPPRAASMAMARSASSPAAPTQTPASAQIPVPLPTLSKTAIPIARPQAVENTKEKEKKSKNRLSASLSLWRLKSKSSLSLRVDSATLSSASSPPPSPSPSPIRTMSSNPSTNPKLFPAGAVTPMVAAEGPTPISVPPVPALPVSITTTPAVPRPQPVTSTLSVDASAEKSARRISGYGEYIHPPQLADTPHSSLPAAKPLEDSVQKESRPEVPLPPPATVISSSSILSTASAASTDSVSSSASDSSSAAGSLFAPTPTTSMSCAGTVSSTPPTSASLSTGGWVSPVTARSVELLKAPSSSRHELGPELEHELEQEVEHHQFGVALSTDELSPMPIPHPGGSHRVDDDVAARDNGMNAHPNDAVVMPTSTLFAVPTPTPTPRPVTGTDMAVSENGAIDLHPRPSHSTKSQSDSRSSSSSRSHSQSRSCVAVSPPLAALTPIVPTPPAPTPDVAPEVEVRSRGSTPTPSQPHTQVPNPTARFEVISRVPKAKSDHGHGHRHGHSRSVELTPRNSMGSRSAARSRASLDAATWKSSSGMRRSKGSQESASEFIVLSRRSGEKPDNSQDRDAEGSAASHSSYSTAQSHSQNPSLASSLPAPPTIARPTSPSSTFAALSRALSTPSESAPSRLQKKPTSQKHSHLQASPSRKRSRNHRRSYLTRQNLFASADIPSDEVGMNQNDGEVDHPSPTYGGDDEDEDILTYTNAKGNRVVHEFGVRVPTDTPATSRIPVQGSIPTATPVSVTAIQTPLTAASHPSSSPTALLPMPVPVSVPRAPPASVANPAPAGGKEPFPGPGSVLMAVSASAQSGKSTRSGPMADIRTQASPTSKLKKEKTTSKKGFFGRLSLFATS